MSFHRASTKSYWIESVNTTHEKVSHDCFHTIMPSTVKHNRTTKESIQTKQANYTTGDTYHLYEDSVPSYFYTNLMHIPYLSRLKEHINFP